MLKVEAPAGAKDILLHTCCAPCSGAILECLRDSGIRPLLFFSNSNITPREEYDLRLGELRRYAVRMGVELVEDAYDHEAWLEAVRGLEDEPERGRRCEACFRFRLGRAAEYAAEQGLPVLATTLASSRWKDLEQVNRAGTAACTAAGEAVSFWPQNWRKGGLQERRNAVLREQGFYNQTWCGCEFSRQQPSKPI